MPYMYKGQVMHIPSGAEVGGAFSGHENAAFHASVQAALNEVQPWEGDAAQVVPFSLPNAIGARVVELRVEEEVGWGVSAFHRMKEPGLSPFVILAPDDIRRETSVATLELAGRTEAPRLTRVYPGARIHPLPWMTDSVTAPETYQKSLDYWHKHAFMHRGVPAELEMEPPEWYSPRST